MKQEQWLYFLRSNFFELDDEIQESVYRSYRKMVYRDIYFLYRNHALTEDVVQESFLKVLAKAPTLQNTNNMKAWVYKIARNQAYDFFKKNKKYHHISESQLVIDTEESFSPVTEQVEDQIRNETLHEALNELNPVHRKALFLFYFEEKSYKDIARELGISEQAIAQTLVRARKKLYRYFSKRWVDGDE